MPTLAAASRRRSRVGVALAATERELTLHLVELEPGLGGGRLRLHGAMPRALEAASQLLDLRPTPATGAAGRRDDRRAAGLARSAQLLDEIADEHAATLDLHAERGQLAPPVGERRLEPLVLLVDVAGAGLRAD